MMLYMIVQSKNKTKLSSVCAIQTGLTARKRLSPSETGGVRAVQLRDVVVGEKLDFSALTRFELGDVPARYFAESGDVLFRSRGERTTATVIDEAAPGAAAVVLPLVLLRPIGEIVTPEYLAWAINQPPAQRHLDETARGTSMRMIPRSALDDLVIDLPNLERQKIIVEIDRLAALERELSIHKANMKKTLIDKILLEQAQGNSETGGPDASQERNNR
jgi:hypothetical protein